MKQTGGRGTFAEYVVVGKEDVVACPEHFVGKGKEGWEKAAAVPLGGLTAYRCVCSRSFDLRVWVSVGADASEKPLRSAVFTKARVEKGQNVLITGIGGGVAITALQFCVAAGEWASFAHVEQNSS